MKKMLVVLLLVLIIIVSGVFGIVKLANDVKEDKRLQEEKLELQKTNASLVIKSVELAYTTAVANNMGVYPTLQQVKNNFSNEHATWEKDEKIISLENEFECSVSITGKLLKVTCLDYETDSNLIVRN